MVNDYLSHKNGVTWRDIDGNPVNQVRLARGLEAADWPTLSSSYIPEPYRSFSTGLSSVSAAIAQAENQLGDANSLFTVGKLDRLLDTVENPDIFDIDITVEGGLGTINAGREETGDEKYFDDTSFIQMSSYYTSDPTTITNTTYRDNWKTIYNRFNDFAEKKRKDHPGKELLVKYNRRY
jgi:hypothetical protein